MRIPAIKRLMWMLSLGSLVAAAPLVQAQLLVTPDQAMINRLGLMFAKVTPINANAGAEVSATIISSPLLADSVHARFSGTLQQWEVSPGDTVASGAVLGRMLSPEVLAIQQEWLQAAANERQAAAALVKDQQLLAAGVISANREQLTRRDAEAASSVSMSLAARLQQAGLSQSELVGLNASSAVLGQYLLRAPQDGVVGRLNIMPGSAVMTGDELLAFNSSTLWLEAEIPARASQALVIGQQLQVPGVSTDVTLRQIDRSLNQRSQTVGIKAEFADSATLRPGQITKLILSPADTGWLVPAEAVVHNGNQTEVFVLTAAGIESRVLQLAPAGSDYQADSGLDGSEMLVVRGAALLKGIALGLGGE